jgi:hypothetical protein
MAMIEAQTELDAVNSMLMSIGQSPVSTLNVTGIKDVSIARKQLTTSLRRCLSMGWDFNTDLNYEVTPTVDNIIPVPVGALSCDPMQPTEDVTIRRHPSGVMAFFNKTDNTFTYTEPLSLKIIWGFPFEDLPECARNYIATWAGRRFQSKQVGSQILDRFEQEDEMSAWIILQREERRTSDTNMFRKSAALSAFGNRRY